MLPMTYRRKVGDSLFQERLVFFLYLTFLLPLFPILPLLSFRCCVQVLRTMKKSNLPVGTNTGCLITLC